MDIFYRLVSLAALVALALWAAEAAGRWLDLRRKQAPRRVEAESQPAPLRLRDLIEQVGNVEADVKLLKREWGDFEKSWERRWGTLARQVRRDAPTSAPAPDEAPGDPSQLDFPMSAPHAPAGPVPRPRLIANSRLPRR